MRARSRWIGVGAAALTLCSAMGAAGVQVTINKGVTYQTIEGFGAMNRIEQWRIKVGPFYQPVPLDNFYDSLVNVLGFTMLRPIEGCAFSPSAGVYSASALRGIYSHHLAIKAVAERSGEPFYACPAIFSPPGYMKYNGTCEGQQESTYPSYTQNSLRTDQYSAFAALMAAYVRTLRDSLGVTTYAISLQNEPYFNEPYASCSYSGGSHYANVLKVVGPAVRAVGTGTLLYGAEHMAWNYPAWENAILADAQAAPYLDRFAVHGYQDGVQADTSTFDSITANGEKPLWMSETGGACETYDDGMGIARQIMRAMTRGPRPCAAPWRSMI